MGKIHFIGIGGVGMAGLALLLKRRGHEVSGCDLSETPRTKWLEANGIEVKIGHDPAHLTDAREVIVTPAVHASNPEFAAALGNRSLPVRRRGEVLAEIVNAAADSIVVSGSHGKTTTATFLSKLLIALGENVEWCIGGETGGFPVAGTVSKTTSAPVLIVEGDESDGTLALYRAKTLVVTNVEYDHPDHFPTPQDYEACFNRARENSAAVVEGGGTNEETVKKVALLRGHDLAAIEKAMERIRTELPDRRFQEIEPGVYIDYAHHPTEIAYTLRRARALCRGVLRVLFQPHRYSRTKALKTEFARALSAADEVVLCPVYAAFESPVEGGDTADLYAEMRKSAHCVYLARSCEEAWTHAKAIKKDGDVTMVLGAGDIVSKLKEIPAEKIWIGAGSNTWKSDLKLPVEYVRTSGAANESGVAACVAPGLKLLDVAPWMAGIPGTIGGWVKMNAGAFGHSISEIIEAVNVDGEWKSAAECGFKYRHSDIEGEIREVKWKAGLVKDSTSAADYLGKRKKFPAGTYGSFFKNPEGDFAGRLLEEAGAKNLRVGGAYVWQEHANVIVRGEGWTASDVLALAKLMFNAVYFRFGIKLEPEVRGIAL